MIEVILYRVGFDINKLDQTKVSSTPNGQIKTYTNPLVGFQIFILVFVEKKHFKKFHPTRMFSMHSDVPIQMLKSLDIPTFQNIYHNDRDTRREKLRETFIGMKLKKNLDLVFKIRNSLR